MPARSSMMSKRKAAPAINKTNHKKPKPAQPEKFQQPDVDEEDQEFAFDSDPIVESDTNEDSGDDDGVEWPGADDDDVDMTHGNDEEPQNLEDGNDEGDEDDEGGVQLPDQTHASRRALINQANDTNGNIASNNAASRESHAKQKALLQERRSQKPFADSISRTMKLWERLRIKSAVPPEERSKLVAELFNIISGNIKDFVVKHDATRVIQTAIKYAKPEQRRMIARELKGSFATLAEGKYAKFLVGKLVSYGDGEVRDLVVPDFYGKVRKLIKHPEAGWILDDLYRGAATKQQKAILLREWYGAEFVHFRQEGEVVSGDLEEVLKEHPEKRKGIMRYLWEMINQLVQKKTTAFTMLHDAMLQYYKNVAPGGEEATEFMELLKGDEEGDLMKNLAFTRPGAMVASLALAHGSAKDRKLLLRPYKDTVATMAFDTNAHMVLLTACEVVDDTVLLSKSILQELVPKDINEKTPEDKMNSLLGMATQLHARTTILLPFSSRPKAILSPAELEFLAQVYEIRTTTSKKEPAIRQKELARAISAPLLSFISLQSEDLCASSFGCQFISEVLLGAEGDKTEALKAMARYSADEAHSETVDSPHGAKMVKVLVTGGPWDVKTNAFAVADLNMHFPDLLFDELGDKIVAWAVSDKAFIISALLESSCWEDAAKKERLVNLLKGKQANLKKAAAEGHNGTSHHQNGKAKGKPNATTGTIASKGAKRILGLLEA